MPSLKSKSAAASGFLDEGTRRKNLLSLSGLLVVLLILNGVIALFSLDYANTKHQEDVHSLSGISASLETARTAQVHFKKQVQEWKNILLRGGKPEDLARYREAFDKEETLMQAELKELAVAAEKYKLKLPLLAQVQRSHLELGEKYRAALQDFRPSEPGSAAAVDAKVRGIDRAPTDEMDKIVADIHDYAGLRAEIVERDARERYQTLRRLTIGTTVFGVAVVAVMLAVSFSRGNES